MAEPTEDGGVPNSGADSGDPADEGGEEKESDELSASGLNVAKTGSSSRGPESSFGTTTSKQHVESEEPDQINVEDVKRVITFSPSINEALADAVAPMRDLVINPVQRDAEQTILHKALGRLKDDFSENRAASELIKMYDLYTSSLMDNGHLETQCRELQEKVKQYEARHTWDPRVLKVLLIAERYRTEKTSVADEKSDLEAEIIDMTIELKHMDDIVKNKNKDIGKLQDDLKKAKEIEKQVENLETIVMRKDNEIHALQELYETALQNNYRLEHQQVQSCKMSMSGADDGKNSFVEKELLARIDHMTNDKLSLKADVEEKQRMLSLAARRLNNLKSENNELKNKGREQTHTIAKMTREVNRLLNADASMQKRMIVSTDQINAAKSEIITLKAAVEGCNNASAHLTHQLKSKEKENSAYQRNVSALQSTIANVKKDKKLCEDTVSLLRQENRSMDHDLAINQRHLSDKNLECENITSKLMKLEQFKARHLDLLKLTRLNATQMAKEITNLRKNIAINKLTMDKAEADMMRMQTQIEALQREYLNALDKNLLLFRNQEMASAAIEQYEFNKLATDRRIAHLMKTNIDLYTQTTSQQEIALIQNHQFHLKENEIKGLLSRLEEEDHKMEKMVCRDKEKRLMIEQLNAEANVQEMKIKSLKSVIESYCQLNKSLTDKNEDLMSQLRACHTQKELVRRQRDLFGTKLLQARAETDLSQEKLRSANDTMTKYSVDFYNMMNDIRVLKLEIKSLRRRAKLSEGHSELILTLRQELGQACKALELQKCKNTILEETRMPMAHRWRGLLASDPSKYEMVLKNQLVIRRLISKSKEIARLEELLKQKDTMYMSLRVLVHRRVNVQLSPEMSEARAVLRHRGRQLKALTAELNALTDDKTRAEARERAHKDRMNDMVIERANEKKAKFRRPNTQKFPQLPPLNASRFQQNQASKWSQQSKVHSRVSESSLHAHLVYGNH